MIVDYTQIGARPYHLQLERESAAYWIVTDLWNPDTVMMRSADQALCVRFMRAFWEKHPGTQVDLYSWRVAQAQTLPQNVRYLFHDHLDEAS